MIFVLDGVGFAEQAEARIAVTLVVQIEQHESALNQIGMAIGKQPLTDKAGLEVTA
jgi:hypothetical protein